ncbi:MAG: hypothetical protein ACI30B_05095, partial [Paludibacteraceae bacterium]
MILPNSETREVSRYGYGGSYIVNYTPKLQGKDIIGWVEIENRDEYGFNLLLVKTDGLYGDWFILNNENNLSRFILRHLRHRRSKKNPKILQFLLF